MFDRLKLLLMACLSLLCASPVLFSAETPHWQSRHYIEQSFYELALQNEYNNRRTAVRKWTQPLTLYVEHQVADKALHQRLLTLHMNHLSDITGLPVSYIKQKSRANIQVFFTRSNQVNQLISQYISPQAVKPLKGSVCLANFRINKHHEIIKALIIIPIDRARARGKLVSCVVEELTQSLGLPNDSKTIHPTIFSDRNIHKLLTGLDYLLLKLLYSPQVKAGMTKAEVKPVIQALLQQWQRDGTIKKAQKKVVEGDLYELLGYR